MPNTSTTNALPKVMVTKLLSALPREFDFYHLGKVKLQDAALSIPLDRLTGSFPIASSDQAPAIGYSFRGDVNGVLILNIPGGADASLYAEMGNVIASMVATRLANEESLDVMISEPTFLSSAALRKLVGGNPALESRTYLHHHESGSIPVSAWIVATSQTNGQADGRTENV